MSDEFKVQWSVSLPPRAQYAKGDMLNVRGETAEEVESLFDSILNSEFMDKATSVGSLIYQAFLVAEGLNHKESEGSASGATVTQDDQPAAGGGKFCEHGKKVWKEGNGAKGKWQGWFCPSNVKTCKPDWVNG